MIETVKEEPQIQFVDGKRAAEFLTQDLRERFIRILIMANNNGVFNEGKVTVLLVDGEPAALGSIDVVGQYPDGRTLHELGNLTVLPEFEGHGFASKLMDYRFRKIQKNHPKDPVMVLTRDQKVALKCLRLGMKLQSGVVVMKIMNPRGKFPDYSDRKYEEGIEDAVRSSEVEGFKNFIFDSMEQYT